MKKTISVLCFIFLLIITGCSNEKINTDITGEIDTEYNYTNKEIKYVVEEDDGSVYSVSANVEIPDLDSINIYSHDIKKYDDEFVKTIADAVFDDSAYEIVKPYFMCTRDEINTEIDYFDNLRYSYDEISERVNSRLDALNGYLEYGQFNETMELTDDELIYSITYEESGTEGLLCHLRGSVDGEICELKLFEDGSGIEIYSLTQKMPFPSGLDNEKELLKALNVSDATQTIEYVEIADTDNLCDIEYAYDYIKKLTYDMGVLDMEVLHVTRLVRYDGVVDGYGFVLGKNFGEVSQGYMSNWTVLSDDEIGNNTQGYIWISVNSEGLVHMMMTDVYGETTLMESDVSILGFEQVNNVAKQYMQENISDLENVIVCNISEIKFSYITILYEDEQYVVVPTWVYYCKNRHGWTYEKDACFGVNALDGTIIHFGDGIGEYEQILKESFLYVGDEYTKK